MARFQQEIVDRGAVARRGRTDFGGETGAVHQHRILGQQAPRLIVAQQVLAARGDEAGDRDRQFAAVTLVRAQAHGVAGRHVQYLAGGPAAIAVVVARGDHALAQVLVDDQEHFVARGRQPAEAGIDKLVRRRHVYRRHALAFRRGGIRVIGDHGFGAIRLALDGRVLGQLDHDVARGGRQHAERLDRLRQRQRAGRAAGIDQADFEGRIVDRAGQYGLHAVGSDGGGLHDRIARLALERRLHVRQRLAALPQAERGRPAGQRFRLIAQRVADQHLIRAHPLGERARLADPEAAIDEARGGEIEFADFHLVATTGREPQQAARVLRRQATGAEAVDLQFERNAFALAQLGHVQHGLPLAGHALRVACGGLQQAIGMRGVAIQAHRAFAQQVLVRFGRRLRQRRAEFTADGGMRGQRAQARARLGGGLAGPGQGLGPVRIFQPLQRVGIGGAGCRGQAKREAQRERGQHSLRDRHGIGSPVSECVMGNGAHQ